jgi:hypothetical protein
MMRIISQVSLSFVGLLSIFLLYSSSNTDRSPDPVGQVSFEDGEDRLPQIIKSIKLGKQYAFAGETLPQENFDALERLDRELLVNSYWHSSTILNLKNAKRYFPIIEPILEEEGVPDDFKYIAVIESNLRNVTSPAGAKGIWQFMRAVGTGYGLEINGEVDERYHIEKSTYAACKLIKDYHKRFGNWTNAAGAYNMGETRFAKEMARQNMDNYYDMNFGQETGRYLFRILAMKEIMEAPNNFGFYVENHEPLYRPFTDCKTVKVESSLPNLGEFAKEHNTTYRMLKVYNPWLISSSLTVSKGNAYDIKVKAE